MNMKIVENYYNDSNGFDGENRNYVKKTGRRKLRKYQLF